MKYYFLLLLVIMFGCQSVDKKPEPVETPPIEVPAPPTEIPDSPVGEPPIVHEPDPVVTTPAPTPVEQPADQPVIVPPASTPEELFTVMGVKLVGATAAQKAKYQKALDVVLKVIKDPEFKKRILAHKKLDKSIGFENTTQSPATVYKKLLEGSETYKKAEIDREADLEVKFYYKNNSTVGYTYPSVGYIMVNTKFFNNYTPSSVAANFIHEYLHKLGYGHDSSATARRPYSVPYGIGGIMRSIGKKYE